MKNQKGSVAVWFLIIIVILVIVGGIYFYSKSASPLVNPVTGQFDVQYNYFSISNGQMATGLGGINPKPATLPSPLIFNPVNPTQYSAVLKISDGTKNLNLAGVSVAQGTEDSLNLNNDVTTVSISGDFFVAGTAGLRVVTVKGGCQNIIISGTLNGHGTEEDINIGDWSDQSYSVSSNIDISGLHEADGSNIKVVVGHASNIVMNSSEVIAHFASDELIFYWQLKYYIRLLLGIPIGTPGPSWMS